MDVVAYKGTVVTCPHCNKDIAKLLHNLKKNIWPGYNDFNWIMPPFWMECKDSVKGKMICKQCYDSTGREFCWFDWLEGKIHTKDGWT